MHASLAVTAHSYILQGAASQRDRPTLVCVRATVGLYFGRVVRCRFPAILFGKTTHSALYMLECRGCLLDDYSAGKLHVSCLTLSLDLS